MAPSLKRKLSTAAKPINAPATRRKVSASPAHKREASAYATSVSLDSKHFNIFSWNVNGIGPLLQKPLSFSGSVEYPLRAFLRRHKWPALLCLQEVKIALTDYATQRNVHHAANGGTLVDAKEAKEPMYVVIFSLPRDKYNAIGFGGKVHGVATLVRQDLSSSGIDASLSDDNKATGTNTTAASWDLEGRVLVTLLSKYGDGKKLAVINGYWVNGTSNPYRDPTSGEVSGTRHDHKLRFHQLMLAECQELEAKGFHVIIIGDMNIAPKRIDGHPHLRTTPVQHVKNRGDFNSKFLDETGWGVDVFRALHGETRKYTYHPRRGTWGDSCDRVDLVVAGKSLIETRAMVGCGIEDSTEERAHSDHVPLWVGIDMDKLGATSR